MADQQTDALVKAAYPAEWAKANSRKRNNLRRRYRTEHEIDKLRAAGARCGNCRHFAPHPSSDVTAHICELDSDFHGYALAQEDGICARHGWKDGQHG